MRSVLCLFFVLSSLSSPSATETDFAAWLNQVRAEAVEQGISPQTLDRAFADLRPLPRVLELDRNQPETTLNFAQYLARYVPPASVEYGRIQLERHRKLLEEIGARYQVQPRFIVAFWGMESNYGRFTGSIPTIQALATLAFDGRRSAYFRRELLDALRILDSGHIDLDSMQGSWAGALGQCQFMPSAFRRAAVDYDGDGRCDIWKSTEDVFASTANFLAQLGWKDDQTWGREVRLPDEFDTRLIGYDARLRLSLCQNLGIRRADGRNLPRRDLWSTLVRPDGDRGRVFIVYDNFHTTLKWNRSTYFALAIGHLSDRLR